MFSFFRAHHFPSVASTKIKYRPRWRRLSSGQSHPLYKRILFGEDTVAPLHIIPDEADDHLAVSGRIPRTDTPAEVRPNRVSDPSLKFFPRSVQMFIRALLPAMNEQRGRVQLASMSFSPQSTQYVLLSSRLIAWVSALHCLTGIFPFTTSPHIGQKRAGASSRRWLVLGQLFLRITSYSSSPSTRTRDAAVAARRSVRSRIRGLHGSYLLPSMR